MFFITLILVIIIAVLVEKIVYRNNWYKGLEVKLQTDNCRLVENDVLQMRIIIANRKNLPLFALKTKFRVPIGFVNNKVQIDGTEQSFKFSEIFTLMPRQMVIRRISFKCTRRGVYYLDNIKLSNQSLFLDEASDVDAAQDVKVSVAPSCVDMNSFVHSFQVLFGSVITNDFDNEDEFLVKGIREYQPYDGFRSVDWNSTAKLNQLMVNTYEHVTNRKVAVFLNLDLDQVAQNEEIAEESIRLAKTWCLNLAQNGVEPNLYTNGVHIENGEYVVVKNDCFQRKYMSQIDEALSHIVIKENDKTFWEIYKDVVSKYVKDYYIIFISAYQHEDFQNEVLSLKKQTKNFTWIIPVNSMSAYRPNELLREHTVKWESVWKRECRSEFFVI